jgi:hypothetical protein
VSSPLSSSPIPVSERLAGSPAVRRGGRWWLVSDAGSIPATDPVFTGKLDHFAAAMAAADHAVAQLRTPQPAPRSGRRGGGR